MSTSKDDNFISGISIHCDRWCERCQFTDRCRLFAIEQERGVRDLRTLTPRPLHARMKGIFRGNETIAARSRRQMGHRSVRNKRRGICEVRAREKEFLDGEEATQLADSYWRPAKELLEDESLKNGHSKTIRWLNLSP